MSDSLPINSEPFKSPYKTKEGWPVSKVEEQLLHVCSNLKGGDVNSGELYVKGDYDNPRNGDVKITEGGIETVVDGVSTPKVEYEQLKKYNSSIIPNFTIWGDSISVLTFPASICNVQNREEYRWASELASEFYKRQGFFSQFGYEMEPEVEGNWELLEEGLNLRTWHSTSATAQGNFFPDLAFAAMPLKTNCEIIYSKRAGGGSFEVKDSEGSVILAAVSCDGATEDGIKTATFAVEEGDVPYIETTDDCYISGWSGTVDGREAGATFTIYAAGGRKLTDFTDDEIEFHVDYAPTDLLVMALGANDYGTSVPVAEYMTKLTKLVEYSKQANPYIDIVFVLMNRNSSAESGAMKEMFSSYKSSLVDYSKQNNILLIDIDHQWGGFTVANARGLIVDDVHPTNPEGYRVLSRSIVDPILNMYYTETNPSIGKDDRMSFINNTEEIFDSKTTRHKGLQTEFINQNGFTQGLANLQPIQSGPVGRLPKTADIGEEFFTTDENSKYVCEGESAGDAVWRKSGTSVVFTSSEDFGTIAANGAVQIAVPIPAEFKSKYLPLAISNYQWVVSVTNFGSMSDVFLSQPNLSSNDNVYVRAYNPTAGSKVVGSLTVHLRVFL